MTDSLKIWGTDYTGVKGFKAKDSSNNQYAYLRPQGTKSITENGNNIDVSEYAIASVNVDRTGGHVIQEGSSIVIPADEVDSGISFDAMALQSNVGAITFDSTTTQIKTDVFNGWTGITSVSGRGVTSFGARCFQNCTGLTSVEFQNATGTGGNTFYGCTSLQTIPASAFPKVTTVGNYSFQNCTGLITAVFPLGNDFEAVCLENCSNLEVVDAQMGIIRGAFRNCAKLNTLVIRKTNVPNLTTTNAFTGTPFASGGTGGTIYIPKSLYDHLGDGTSSDYRNQTNWAAVYGYGTITFAQIEGSYYETHYADGTEIPST